MKSVEHFKTDRLVIRRFMEEDLDPYLDFMQDERATRFLCFNEDQKTEFGAVALFAFIMASYQTSDSDKIYAVTRKGGGFIGCCSLHNLNGNGTYECTCGLRSSQWGRGYSQEVIRAILGYSKQSSAISEMRFYLSPEDPVTIAVAQNPGMVYLGVEKHPVYGCEKDVYVMVCC